MNCGIGGCTGEYEPRSVIRTLRRNGEVIVVDHVPAEVCTVCGDVLLEPETVRALERLLRETRKPDASVPLYEYA